MFENQTPEATRAVGAAPGLVSARSGGDGHVSTLGGSDG